MSPETKINNLSFNLTLFLSEANDLETRIHKSAVGKRHAKNMFWTTLFVTLIALTGVDKFNEPILCLPAITTGTICLMAAIVWLVNNSAYKRDEKWLGQTEEAITALRSQIDDLKNAK